MKWTTIILAVAVVAVFYLLKRLSFISAAEVRKLLVQGALVVDVRSREEFRSDHVPTAINIPLPELRETLPQRVPDKGQPLLVHCLSGGRSAIAKQQLRGMGYTNVFNLGSLGRAKSLVTPKPGEFTRSQ